MMYRRVLSDLPPGSVCARSFDEFIKRGGFPFLAVDAMYIVMSMNSNKVLIKAEGGGWGVFLMNGQVKTPPFEWRVFICRRV